MKRSAVHITYKDVLKKQERRLEYMEKTYPVKVLRLEITSATATYDIEVQRILVKLLQKFDRNKQLDLFDAFQQMAKK